jgi:NAD(P)-dependent dehydrogenase (short-subunit alcohol dehydrogenase family)
MGILDKFSLEGKKAFVTGASRGIGKVVARGLCEAGADVAFIGTKLETAVAAAEEAAKLTGARTIGIQADISKPDQVQEMMQKIMKEFGTIDVVFNNAGIANANMNAEDMPFDLINEIMQVNYIGVFLCCQAAGKIMIPKRKGSIINMASMSAHIVNVPQRTSNYAPTKSAVITLTKNLAAEWAPHNVRVNSISPGYHMTELAQQFETLFPPWLERIPMQRFGDPAELTGAVVFFASDASSYTTGADLIMDGGYSLW